MRLEGSEENSPNAFHSPLSAPGDQATNAVWHILAAPKLAVCGANCEDKKANAGRINVSRYGGDSLALPRNLLLISAFAAAGGKFRA